MADSKRSFDIDYSDPFAVLGVTEMSSPEEVKRAYDTLVLHTHPDNGGNPEVFSRIQTAYIKLKKMFSVKDHASLKKSHAQASKMNEQRENQAMLTTLHQSGYDPRNISSGAFNKLFEEMHLKDPSDQGYGSRLVASSKVREQDDKIPDIAPLKMERHHDGEPMAIISSGEAFGSCYELGVATNNFSRLGDYTDYMEAHSDSQTEASFEEFKRKVESTRPQFKTWEEYQKYSDAQVARPDTDEEVEKRRAMAIRKEMEDNIRRNRQQQRDRQIEDHFAHTMTRLPAPVATSIRRQ
jgi:curved DNA-binding protein CbpA